MHINLRCRICKRFYFHPLHIIGWVRDNYFHFFGEKETYNSNEEMYYFKEPEEDDSTPFTFTTPSPSSPQREGEA